MEEIEIHKIKYHVRGYVVASGKAWIQLSPDPLPLHLELLSKEN